jgi:hypothetical protein
MSFEDTVKKIAASPLMRELFGEVPSYLYKEATGQGPAPGLLGRIFGGAKDSTTGMQDVYRNIAGNVGAGALMAGGGYLAGKAVDRVGEPDEQIRAKQQSLGRLMAEQDFRNTSLQKLNPLHEQVFTELGADPIIAKADPQLIQSAYSTMKRIAPHLSADPNAARSFLREHAIYGTGPSYASLKTLADAEQAVSRAGGG